MWTFQLALRYLFPKSRWGTFFTWISIVGITLGVMVLIIVLSVMNGFDRTIQQKLEQLNGPIKILSTGIIEDPQHWIRELSSVEGVLAVTPFTQGLALVQHGNHVCFPKCLGVDPKTVTKVLPLERFLRTGQLRDLNKGIFLSTGLAQTLQVKVGHSIDLYSPLSLEAIKQDEVLLPQELQVVGIFETEWAEVDRDTLICSLETLQELYGLGSGVHGFSLKVASNKSLPTLCKMLNEHLPKSMRAYTWMDLNADFLSILKMEKGMSSLVLLFVILVACFSISSGLMSSVVRKTREIALLRVWGAHPRHIIAIFCGQALVLSFFGIIFGFMTGMLALKYRDWIINSLVGWLFPKDFLWNFYDFHHLPAAYLWQDFVWITLFTFIIALLAALVPALKASFSNIVEGLRHD